MFGQKSSAKKTSLAEKTTTKKPAAKKPATKTTKAVSKTQTQELQNISDKNSLQNLSFSILPMMTITIR